MKELLMSEYIYSIKDKENLGSFLTGHLSLEYIIDKLLVSKIEDSSVFNNLRLRFEQKIYLLKGFNLINREELKLLKEINKVRNYFSHRLEFDFDFEMAFELVNLAHDALVEFTDNNIWANKAISEEIFGVEGIIREVITNTNMHMAYKYEEIGGEIYW